jgi:hypothetical protein
MCSQILVDSVAESLTVLTTALFLHNELSQQTRCLGKASNSKCYSSDMFRHFIYQGVKTVTKITVHKCNIAYINIQTGTHRAKLGKTI